MALLWPLTGRTYPSGVYLPDICDVPLDCRVRDRGRAREMRAHSSPLAMLVVPVGGRDHPRPGGVRFPARATTHTKRATRFTPLETGILEYLRNTVSFSSELDRCRSRTADSLYVGRDAPPVQDRRRSLEITVAAIGT